MQNHNLSRTAPLQQHYNHQYNELVMTTTDSSDCSVTYTVPPVYPGSDNTTYSTTTAIYHEPNCNCHIMRCQPNICQSPSRKERLNHTNSTVSGSGSDTVNSSSKEAWIRHHTDTPVQRWTRPIAWIWAVVTLVLFFVSILCLTQSSWIINSKTGESFGVIKQTKLGSKTVLYYNNSESQEMEISVSWKICLALFSVSIALLGISSLLAVGTVLLTLTKTRETVSCTAGSIQLFAVILLITSLLFYMVGLDSRLVTDVCQDSSVFYLGECSIGWNYLLLIICSALGFLLPVLSHYIDYNVCTTPSQIDRPSSQMSNC